MVAAETPTDFSSLFKDEFTRLFKRPRSNAAAIQDALIRMVKYIMRGWTFPSEEVMRDVQQDTVAFVISPDILKQVDPKQNPAAWFRTVINRAIGNSLSKYPTHTEEVTDETISVAMVHDPMQYARDCREPLDTTIKDFLSKVHVAEQVDTDLDNLMGQYREAEDYEVMQGIYSAVFALQKMRKKLIGEYKPLTIETTRFLLDTFIRFAPKEK